MSSSLIAEMKNGRDEPTESPFLSARRKWNADVAGDRDPLPAVRPGADGRFSLAEQRCSAKENLPSAPGRTAGKGSRSPATSAFHFRRALRKGDSVGSSRPFFISAIRDELMGACGLG